MNNISSNLLPVSNNENTAIVIPGGSQSTIETNSHWCIKVIKKIGNTVVGATLLGASFALPYWGVAKMVSAKNFIKGEAAIMNTTSGKELPCYKPDAIKAIEAYQDGLLIAGILLGCVLGMFINYILQDKLVKRENTDQIIPLQEINTESTNDEYLALPTTTSV
jgi:hypothetical protein